MSVHANRSVPVWTVVATVRIWKRIVLMESKIWLARVIPGDPTNLPTTKQLTAHPAIVKVLFAWANRQLIGSTYFEGIVWRPVSRRPLQTLIVFVQRAIHKTR